VSGESGSSVSIVSAMGWAIGLSRLAPRQRQDDFSSNVCVQTCSGAHPASCTMGTGGPLPGVKSDRGLKLTTPSSTEV
jgi:hypothetical protein